MRSRRLWRLFSTLTVVAAFAGDVATAAASGDLRLTPFDPDAVAGVALGPSPPYGGASVGADPDTLLAAVGIVLVLGLALIGAAAAVNAIRLRRLRSALERSDRHFASLADQTSDLVGFLREGRLVLTVDKLLGYGPSRESALPLAAIVHADDLAGVERMLSGPEASGARGELRCRLLRRDAALCWVDCAVRRTAGEIMLAARDVTDRLREAEKVKLVLDAAKEAQVAADEGNRAKAEFLASMSHEIRTPLNAIIGFADLLLDTPDLPPAGRRSAERIKAGGDALLTIVNDVLDFSQLESGALRLKPAPFVLPLLVDECIALVERLALSKKLALRVELNDRFPAGVLGDEARLRQILLNLINNAIKFTDAGSITVKIRLDHTVGPNRVVFEITDTGIGIAQEDLPRLFQRFRQIDGTMRRSRGGTGLGLVISKALVERMGGEIGVESRMGAGSTFWFALDLPPASLVLEAERPPVRPVSRQRLKILLVEDIALNQELARAILEARDHDVDVVGDGADAVMAVENDTFDLVLMDVQMPYVDGLTAARAIRLLPVPSRSVPIVAMTANVLRQQVASARAAGMDDVLAKPLSLETIDAFLDRASRNAIVEVSEPDVLDDAVLAALARETGTEGLVAQLVAFERQLASRFTRPPASFMAADLRAEAIASIAPAKQLGFRRFANACGDLIEAALSDESAPYERLLRDLRQALLASARARMALGEAAKSVAAA